MASCFILPSERAKAVWKNGLNVNLASKLTWYKISIEDIEVKEEEWGGEWSSEEK
jgi:transcription antitermination factor NusA-like protein